MQETQVQSLGWEDPLEKEGATHPSILAWDIAWTEESSALQSMGSQKVGHDWSTERVLTHTHAHTHTHTHTHVVCILIPRTCTCVLYMEKGTLWGVFKNIYLAALSLSWGMRDLLSSLRCVESFSCSVWTLSCSFWDLVPWPGFKPKPSALREQSLSHWTTRKSL